MPITIRTSHPEDLEAISHLEQEAFTTHSYPPFFFRQAYEIFSDLFRVAESNGEIVGYIIGSLQSGSTEGWIMSLAVKKENRGKGIAKMLIESVVKILSGRGAKNVLLTVEPENTHAITIYHEL